MLHLMLTKYIFILLLFLWKKALDSLNLRQIRAMKFDIAVIGGGIVGAATFYKLQKRNPNLKKSENLFGKNWGSSPRRVNQVPLQ